MSSVAPTPRQPPSDNIPPQPTSPPSRPSGVLNRMASWTPSAPNPFFKFFMWIGTSSKLSAGKRAFFQKEARAIDPKAYHSWERAIREKIPTHLPPKSATTPRSGASTPSSRQPIQAQREAVIDFAVQYLDEVPSADEDMLLRALEQRFQKGPPSEELTSLASTLIRSPQDKSKPSLMRIMASILPESAKAPIDKKREACIAYALNELDPTVHKDELIRLIQQEFPDLKEEIPVLVDQIKALHVEFGEQLPSHIYSNFSDVRSLLREAMQNADQFPVSPPIAISRAEALPSSETRIEFVNHALVFAKKFFKALPSTSSPTKRDIVEMGKGLIDELKKEYGSKISDRELYSLTNAIREAFISEEIVFDYRGVAGFTFKND